jgi:hypothetical protein
MPNDLSGFLSGIKVSDAVGFGSLHLFPLLREADQGPCSYLTLDQAIADGRFRITEISESGAVPELRAENQLDRPVFLLDGEELIGAKQNRVLNLSLIIGPQSVVIVPVSCVEAGRWQHRTAEFAAADRTQFARGRARKMEQVSRSLREDGWARADQGDVWDEIAAKSERMAAHSSTGAMAEIFDSNRHRLDDYLAAFPPRAGQAGAGFAIGGRLVGIEIFDSPATYADLCRKLVSSYALDAMEALEGPAPSNEAVQLLLEATAASEPDSFPAPGIGRTLRISNPKLSAAALVADATCIHLMAFPGSNDDQRSQTRARRARL